MEGETETAGIDQKSTFFLFLCLFSKIQDITKSKTLIFKRGQHKNFLGQALTIFQTVPQAIMLVLWSSKMNINQLLR